MESKSFLSVNEIGNVICDWKIDNKTVEVKGSSSSLIFTWPLTKCQLILLVWRRDENTYFISVKKNLVESFPFKLSGTISIITAEQTVHVLGQFEDCTFEEDEVIYLKDIRELKSEKDILFPNNNLTLRIHLWKPSVRNEVTVKHHAYSKCTEEKCFFQWILKSETDDIWNECFTKYVTEVPRIFKDFEYCNLFRISMILEFGKSSDAHYGITVTIKTSPAVDCCAKFEIDAENEAGISKSLLNTQFVDVDEGITIYQCPKTEAFEELRSNKSMYYPKGYLKLYCKVTVKGYSEGVVEEVCFISDTQSPKCSVKLNPSEDTLKDCMYILYRQGEFCDVTLCTEEEKFPCHKNVLCARSPVFKAMFQTDMSEKENGIVSILDVNTRAFGSFLTALYTDTLDGMDFKCALNLYAIADRYAVSAIQKKCAAFLLPQLSTSNVCEVLELADTHQDEELKIQAEEFFCKHVKKIMKSAKWSQLMSRNSFLAAQVMQRVISERV